MKKWLLALLSAAPVIAGVAVFFWGTTKGNEWRMGPPEMRGNAMLARMAGGERLVFLVHREEDPVYRSRNVGPLPRQHFELHCFSIEPLEPVWRRRLATEHNSHPDGGDLKLLGVDGDRVWVFLREPLAVSLGDGAIVASASMIEAENPALAGLLPELPREDQSESRVLLVALETATGAIHRYAVEADERANDAVDGATPEPAAAANLR